MRFHVVSLPHTHTTAEFQSCAFTQKVRRFCAMMTKLGHTVILYSGEKNDALCFEHVMCIGDPDRRVMVGSKHYTEADWGHPLWGAFNQNVIKGLTARLQPQDFICLIGGFAQKPIADAFPAHLSVEFGIGYAATFAKYRVFESYAWMHMIYGAEVGRADKKDGHWFDAMIPNQIEDIYKLGKGDGGYALYMGRLVDRKGYRIAQEVCEAEKIKLVLAGPGNASGYGEFVGEVNAIERARLMEGAFCLMAPTQYIEPFGTVHIEAMACGTPIIATDWGVFTETVGPDDGLRCRTFEEFRRALLMTHGGAFNRASIRERAIARFSMEVVGKQYETYFKRLSTLWGKGWYA